MRRETRNAKIERTSLGFEGHGILTAWLHLSWKGGGQGFGGYAMDGHAYGSHFIRKVLETVGVESWEDLPGKHVRMDHDHGKVYRIGHITDDEWFDPAALADELRAAGPTKGSGR